MTQTPPPSGNRWEPTPGSEPVELRTSAEQPTTEPVPAVPSAPMGGRTRSALAGGAAAVLLAGGLGGFAIGRATAADGGAGQVDQQGVPTGFDHDDHGPGYPPGEGFPAPGNQPPATDAPDGSDTGTDT